MTKKITLEISCSLIICLFLYASVSKWLDFRTFIGDMNNQPLPNVLTPWLVWGIPFSEVLIALALMFDRSRKAGLFGSLILMSAFTVYTVIILMHFFEYVPCSCGGVIKKLTWNQHLFFNLFFVGLSLLGLWLCKNNSKNSAHEGTNGSRITIA
jgi:hypothetical protein